MTTDRLKLLALHILIALSFIFSFTVYSSENEGENSTPAEGDQKESEEKKEEPAKTEDKNGGHEKLEMSLMVEKPAKQSSRDVRLPKPLVKRLERDYREFLNKLEVSSKEPIKRGLLILSVELTQKKEAALHEDVRVVTPPGGGVVDLAEFVTPLLGAFKVKFNVSRDDGTIPLGLRVFFVSNARIRNIGGQDYGAGCNQYMEITTQYLKTLSRNGIETYTAEQRYVSVLGGTYVFVSFEKEAMRVGSISFSDSRHMQFLCEEK